MRSHAHVLALSNTARSGHTISTTSSARRYCPAGCYICKSCSSCDYPKSMPRASEWARLSALYRGIRAAYAYLRMFRSSRLQRSQSIFEYFSNSKHVKAHNNNVCAHSRIRVRAVKKIHRVVRTMSIQNIALYQVMHCSSIHSPLDERPDTNF